MTKEYRESMTASEWIRINVTDTDLLLTEESAKLFAALSVGGFGTYGFKVNAQSNMCTLQV